MLGLLIFQMNVGLIITDEEGKWDGERTISNGNFYRSLTNFYPCMLFYTKAIY